MSDPVTNVEIEDVLSSIRRLVSDGEKARKPAAKQADTDATASSRLVLTPALRVDEPQDEPAVVADAPDAEDVASEDFLVLSDGAEPLESEQKTSPSEVEDRASLEATIAELEAAVTAQPDEWEPDGSEVDYTPNWDRTLFQAVEEAVENATRDSIAPAVADALAEAPVDDTLDAESEPQDVVPEDTEDATQDVDWESDAVLAPTAAEAIVAKRQITPDAPEADAARVAFRHLDRDDTLRPDALTGAPTAEAAAPKVQDLSDDALRQMVLGIVREELNGKLGERITRNVRKLVRREIMRVLNAQDLD